VLECQSLRTSPRWKREISDDHLEKKELSPLIDKAIKEMQPLAEAKKIHLSKKTTEALPVLEMDSERILQALRNLIGML